MGEEHRIFQDQIGPGVSYAHRGLHRVAVVAAVSTLLLVFVGGSVTSNDAGMAVPDWPTTFGRNMFLYPPGKWVGGILFEHSHRLTGAVTGLLIIVLAVWAQLREPRRWVRIFAWIILAAVIVQGVLGGLRVTERSMALAMVHGCLGQLFFCLTICMVLCTSRSWIESRPVEASTASRFWKRFCLATSLAILGQSIAGAVYRQYGVGLAYHIVGAVVVTILISAVVMWLSGEHGDQKMLLRLVKLVGGLLVVQLALGVGAYVATSGVEGAQAHGAQSVGLALVSDVTFLGWFVPSVHVAVGASLLAVSVALTMSVYKILGPGTVLADGELSLKVSAA